MPDSYLTRRPVADETRNSRHVGLNHVVVTVVGGQHRDPRDDLPCIDAVCFVTSEQTRKERVS